MHNFGYEKDEKLAAAQALKKALLEQGNTYELVLDEKHQGALTQGRLGKIASLSNCIEKNSLEFRTPHHFSFQEHAL